MGKKKTTNGKVEIDSIGHKKAERVNNPTEELRDFIAHEEQAPSLLKYPRDQALDPQLVWKGKDEQDSRDLIVPSVPIYVQEKIHPRAIIESIRSRSQKAEADDMLPGLFADFNGLTDFDKKIEFYRHPQHWTNRLILGDCLHVMTSLADKEGLKGKVQMIYVDPPYGIKFGSNWQVSTRKRDVKDGRAEDATRQPEQIRAFRDTWELGIHSYLAYLRDRLRVSRDLLTESGSIFVQIGDENEHLVRSILDEIFGNTNFVSKISYITTNSKYSSLLMSLSDNLLWYAKNIDSIKYSQLYLEKGVREGGGWAHNSAELEDGTRIRPGVQSIKEMIESGERIRPYSLSSLSSQGQSSHPEHDWMVIQGKKYHPGVNHHWKTTKEGMQRLILANRIEASKNSIRYVRFLDDFSVQPITNIWDDTTQAGYADAKLYVVQTLTKVVERCLLMTTDPGDLVIDPTCGSGTTAYVAEQWGRRWITIDTSRVALALARTRIMAARFPYYLLADSPEGVQKEAEITGQVPPDYQTEGDIRKGFVYKRVPHVTLKSIANNPDIKEGMNRAEIEAAIARHADSEILYDKPYEDPKRVRVTGPFTVESLSPHRVLATEEERPTAETEGQRQAGPPPFETMILDNLRKAGVQNTKKAERLKFDRLDPFAGTWIHATGEYTDASEKTRRVAVSIGPEHGTVGPQLVKEAAKEAVQGLGFDLLLIAGFAFDPHVSEETRRYGSLTIQPVKMNPDLSMGDELLKKTGTGNLFMIFGEPDIEVEVNGKVTVEIQGLDVYDPTTGQVRSSSTDDIACWFLDTDYNAEEFFVRHAYFTGADDPYTKLKRALRAEIDEAQWSALNSTRSYPFDLPKSGKIAVKVINHYGDEVLKVFSV